MTAEYLLDIVKKKAVFHVKYRLPLRGRYDGLQYRLLLKSASSLPTGRQAETETMLDNKSKAR